MNDMVKNGELAIRSFLGNNNDFTPLVVVCDNKEVNAQLMQIFGREFQDSLGMNLVDLVIISVEDGHTNKIFSIMTSEEFEGYSSEVTRKVKVCRLEEI